MCGILGKIVLEETTTKQKSNENGKLNWGFNHKKFSRQILSEICKISDLV